MRRNALGTLFFTIFLDMVGVGILIPVIPVLFADPSSPHYLLATTASPGEGYLYLGVMMALYSLGQFIASPVIGQLSDRFGRKKMLTLSILGTAVGHALFALSILMRAPVFLLIVRFLTGLSTGNIVVSQAAIADLTKPEDRAKNFGLIGAAFGLGFIIGPFIGGKLADPGLVSWFSASTPFWFASFLSLANLLFVSLRFTETNTATLTPHRISPWKALENIGHAIRMKSLRSLFVTGFLMQTGFSFYVTFASVFLFWRFGFTEGSIGNYFAYVGLWIVFTQGVVTRFMNTRFREQEILRNSLIVMGLAILAILIAPHSSWLYVIVPFFSISAGLSQSNLGGLLSRSAPKEHQGEILGVNGSLIALSATIPPLLAGPIAAKFEPTAPLLIASMIIISSGLYFIDHERRRART